MKQILSAHFQNGWVSPAWAARADLEVRRGALLEAENVSIRPQGGARKRPCLSVIAAVEANTARIFGWHRSERERFLVGITRGGEARIYNTDIPTPDNAPAIKGSLSFANAERINAFHFADTMIITTPGQSPQEIVLQDRAALESSGQVRTIIETGIALESIPDTLSGRDDAPELSPNHYAGVSLTLRIGTESDTVENALLGSLGSVYYNGGFTIGGQEYIVFLSAGRNEANPTWRLQFRTRETDEFIPLDADIRLEVSRAGTTDTIQIVAVATGLDAAAVAEGFEARAMTIKNPPVIRLSAADYATATAGGSAIAGACITIPAPASVGDKPANKGKVLTWDGTTLSAATPGDEELGLPPGRWCMEWNARDGWPSAAGFRDGRLIFAGSGAGSATLWFSTIGAGRNFLQARAAPQPKVNDVAGTEDLNGSEVEADYGMKRILNSFERIVSLYADNQLVIFTEGGELAVSGNFDASSLVSAQARKYSNYGSAPNVGSAAVDRVLFFAARQSAFVLEFQGDDIGYSPTNITTLRNEEAFGGREVIRLVAVQSAELNGANVALFLVGAGGGENPYLAAFHTDRATGHAAWTKWTFPRHRIIDMAQVDNDVLLLADELDEGGNAVVRRVIVRLDGEAAEVAGMAGDEVEGGRVAFPCVLRTPDLLVPQLAGEGWVYPKTITRAHMDAAVAGGAFEADEVEFILRTASGAEKKYSFGNLAPGEAGEPPPAEFGRRSIDCGTYHPAQKNARYPLTATIRQENLRPFHIFRADFELEVEKAIG